ncbi:MAG: murein biosynthesis integral membrane protein MurJ [Acidiferrobacterales bacterium]|nr:murein biosynthesis integral membrane protein MurJ [Acidiferrobacterales bacterium]
MSSRILKSTSVVGSMTLLSRLSGMVRDVVFAHLLGDKDAADVFFVAFRIPNFFRRITAEGAFSAAFVPVFTDFRENRSEDQNSIFIQLMLGRFGLILLLITFLGVLGSEYLVSLLAWGFKGDPQKFQLTVTATQIAFPYLFFISLVAMAAGMLNTCGRFAAPAATPVLLNACLIFAAIVFVPLFTDAPIALAFGVLLAGVVQLVFQIPFLRKEKLTIRPRVRANKEMAVGDRGVAQVFRLMIPAIFGASAAQLNVLINTVLASLMTAGSISWLYYSDRLMEFPVGVFGIALGTVLLPNLSKKYTSQSMAAFGKTLDWGMRWVWLICIPATIALVVLAKPLIATIFYHGDFSVEGVHQASRSLIAFSLGLIPIVMVKVLANGFYARKNTRKPVRVGMIAVAINIAVSLLLFYPLQHVGLALATSVAALANAYLLYSGLRAEQILTDQPGWFSFLLRAFAASLVMGLILYFGAGDVDQWVNMEIFRRVLKLLLLVLAGGISYFILLFLFGLRVNMMWLDRESE